MNHALAVAVIEDAGAPADVAAELLSEHRIVQKALPVMVARVMADPDLRAAVLEELIEGQCRRILEAASQLRYQTEKRRTGGGPIGEGRSSDVTGWAGAVASSLMDDFKLPSGKKLGDAGRADLEAAMGAYQIQAQDAEIKFRWLRLIQQSLPSGKTVRQHLTDERLAELKAEARTGDA